MSLDAVLRIGFAVRVARATGARAQGAALRTEGAVVFGGRHAQAGIHRVESAPPSAGAGRRRLRALRVERDRRIPGRGLSGPRRAAVSRRRPAARAGAPAHRGSRQLLLQGHRRGARRRRSGKSRRSASPTRSRRAARRWSTKRRCSREAMRGDFLAGPLSAADFTLYPLVAALWRAEMKLPDLDAAGMLTPELRAWKKRIEALPYFDKTIAAALEDAAGLIARSGQREIRARRSATAGTRTGRWSRRTCARNSVPWPPSKSTRNSTGLPLPPSDALAPAAARPSCPGPTGRRARRESRSSAARPDRRRLPSTRA